MSKQMSEDEIDDCVSMIHEALEKFEEAIYELSKVARVMDQSGHTDISARLTRYTIGNILQFTEEDNYHQVGNLFKDILPSLEELRRPCDEDLRAIGYETARDKDGDNIETLKNYASSYAYDLAAEYDHDGHVQEMIHEGIQDRIQELEGKEFNEGV